MLYAKPLDRNRINSGGKAWLGKFILLTLQLGAYITAIIQLAPAFGYTRPAYTGIDLAALLVALPILVIVARALPSPTRTVSDSATWILTSFLLVPTLAHSVANSFFSRGQSLYAALLMAVGVGAFFLFIRLFRPPTSRIVSSRATGLDPKSSPLRRFSLGVGVLSILGMALIYWYYDFSGINLDFQSIYERRTSRRGIAAPLPGSDHFILWMNSILLPLLVLLAVLRRKVGTAA